MTVAEIDIKLCVSGDSNHICCYFQCYWCYFGVKNYLPYLAFSIRYFDGFRFIVPFYGNWNFKIFISSRLKILLKNLQNEDLRDHLQTEVALNKKKAISVNNEYRTLTWIQSLKYVSLKQLIYSETYYSNCMKIRL